jgi:hypothetical protein
MSHAIRATLLGMFLLALPVVWGVAQGPQPPVKRAVPPKFTKGEPFYADAFKELSGTRPANLGQPPVAVASGTNPASSGSSSGSGATGVTGSDWASLISPLTLENEIKAQKLGADMNISTPTDFTSKGYKYVRREFSIAAMVFAIIAEYSGDVRFKKEATTMRDAFAQTAANAKVATQQVYAEAKVRRDDLGDLINGQSPALKADLELKADWGKVCSRSPLMQRLEMSLEPKIKAWTADKGNFNSNLEALEHEAQIFAVIGAVLQKDGLEDGDDADYAAFAKMLVQGGADLARACKEKDHAAAEKAVSGIAVSCDKCHESYR